jgi:uncharacterized membrane protein YdjX (TVP38/TMEM64 family)
MTVPADRDPTLPSTASGFRLARFLPFAVIVLVSLGVIVTVRYGHLYPLALLERRVAVEVLVGQHYVAALAAFVCLYAVAVALSLPGAVLLTICGGILFGGLVGGLAALVGATVGSAVIFMVAKSACGGWLMRRAGPRAEALAAGFCADAFNYLLFLRLVPVFPFWLVNLVPALCGVRLATFMAATALGIIPGTFAFAFFGAGLDSALTAQVAGYRDCIAAGGTACRLAIDRSAAATPQLIAGLVALGVLALVPVVVRRFRAARCRQKSPAIPEALSDENRQAR